MMASSAVRRGVWTSARRFLSAEAPPGAKSVGGEAGPRQVLGREARRARQAELASQGALASGSSTSREALWTGLLWSGVGLGSVGISGAIYLLMADPRDNAWAKKAQESAAGAWLTANVEEVCKPFVDPSRDKLLPDWPPDYLNISADVPCPHTLVVDLEETLVRATWDRRHGWRHAKRPGADAFLREMSKYYEIVIFTSNIAGVADPVIHSLDKEGCAMHRLYRDATKFVRGAHCKDVARLNRDPRKVVVIDDDPLAVQLAPRNAILVSPYTDPNDRTDTELEDLVPFLAALVNEGVRDIPSALSKFSANDAKTVAAEYDAMLAESKKKAHAVRNIGLGGFVRSSAAREVKPAPARPLYDAPVTAKDIVGDAPPPPDSQKGWLWRSFEKRSKEAEEQNKLKMEAWQKTLQKKDQAKRMAAEQK